MNDLSRKIDGMIKFNTLQQINLTSVVNELEQWLEKKLVFAIMDEDVHGVNWLKASDLAEEVATMFSEGYEKTVREKFKAYLLKKGGVDAIPDDAFSHFLLHENNIDKAKNLLLDKAIKTVIPMVKG